jgi:N-methylhydantoinase A
MGAQRAAEGIIAVINANMIRGIRRVSVEQGYDPREFALVAFGGAGPLHAVQLAQALNMTKIIIPPYPGIASAFGMLSADVRHDYVQTYISLSTDLHLQKLQSIYEDMEKQGREQLRQEAFPDESIVVDRFADIRYARQAYELSVPVKGGMLSAEDISGVAESFHERHERNYGYARRGEGVEFVNMRVVALGKLPDMRLSEEGSKTGQTPEPAGERGVSFEAASAVRTPIYQRDHMAPGQEISGPAVVEQLDSTTLVFPHYRAVVDRFGNLIITDQGA